MCVCVSACACSVCVCARAREFVGVCVLVGQSRAYGLVARYSKCKSNRHYIMRFTLVGWVDTLLRLYLLYSYTYFSAIFIPTITAQYTGVGCREVLNCLFLLFVKQRRHVATLSISNSIRHPQTLCCSAVAEE